MGFSSIRRIPKNEAQVSINEKKWQFLCDNRVTSTGKLPKKNR